MKALITAASLILAGCATRSSVRMDAQPFAVLYGARKAQWLGNNQRAIFSGKPERIDFNETEITGFRELDGDNQKLYLIVRFCEHDLANAEGGSQLWRLVAALKCPKKELSDYIDTLDEKALSRYASYLHGSVSRFHQNARQYLQ